MSATTVTLSLISHTNVGKTTLARTLLRRDIGEVFDQPHVTDSCEEHTLMETGDGIELKLWDTPGFGDSFRLWKRLEKSETALGKFLTGVWDRFTDRPFWCSQQAILNVRDKADVVLYLANAAEGPNEAGYVEPEMQILEWLGKPVIVLLNQMGSPRESEHEDRDLRTWREKLKDVPVVRDVLVFDAFARCWVQEIVLWRAVGKALPELEGAAMDGFIETWQLSNRRLLQRGVERMALALADIANDAEPVTRTSLFDRFVTPTLKRLKSSEKQSMQRLAERLSAILSATTTSLIHLHGLSGEAAKKIESRFDDDFAFQRPVDKSVVGTIGGFVTGAASGLTADLLAGGLTFGGGALVGGLVGAVGGTAAAHGYNLVKGEKQPKVRWSPEFLQSALRALILRYLAVAHFGRGRGNYNEGECPAFWNEQVNAIVEPRENRIKALQPSGGKNDREPRPVGQFESLVSEVLIATLSKLYPDADSALIELNREETVSGLVEEGG